ncbi:MAG: hypothetical protein NVV63_15920 [Opitutus sp.]|nr:hypothetical protein [Opitutus sp.]
MSRRSLFLVALWCVAVVRGAPASPADVLIVADETVIAPLRGNLSESVTTTRASWTFGAGRSPGNPSCSPAPRAIHSTPSRSPPSRSGNTHRG